MADAQTAVEETWEALATHFRRSAEPVKVPEEVMEMTGLDEDAVKNACAVLKNNGQVEGPGAWQTPYPLRITKVNY